MDDANSINAWQTIGHTGSKDILVRQLQSGKFSHAYLFLGPEGVGKKCLAMEFAKKVLGTENLANHPDFYMLDSQGEITVEQARGFMDALGFKPFVGAKKVAVVNNAQNLNVQSGNALLKSLEEPSPSTIIILIASSSSLLSTIVSRCQVFYFYPAPEQQLREFAQQAKLTVNPDMLALSFGRIGRLKELQNSPVMMQREQKYISSLGQLSQSSVAERLLAIAEYADLETEELQKVLQTWLFWQKFNLKTQILGFSRLQRLMDALEDLGQNLNKKLILQNLFLNI